MSARAYVARLSPSQLQTLDAQAAQVDLRALGWDLSSETARACARWQKDSPRVFARRVAEALRESWMNRRERGPFPYRTCYVARAIELRMEGA